MLGKYGNNVCVKDIFIDDGKLSLVHHYEYLGMLIEDKLNMDKHVEVMYKKVNSSLVIMSRIRRFITYHI